MALTMENARELIRANNNSTLSDDLVLCLAYKESTLMPGAKNSAPGSTATGLMQVTVAAITDVNKNFKAFGANFQRSDMTDAVKNIQCGTYYLRLRLKWAKNDVKKALAGYGEGLAYATSILTCEKCVQTKSSKSMDCLKATHSHK